VADGVVCSCAGFLLSYAQQLPPEVERMAYADTIFINGKIVSMDDASSRLEYGGEQQMDDCNNDKDRQRGHRSHFDHLFHVQKTGGEGCTCRCPGPGK